MELGGSFILAVGGNDPPPPPRPAATPAHAPKFKETRDYKRDIKIKAIQADLGIFMHILA